MSCIEKITEGFIDNCGHRPKAGILRKWYVNFSDIDKVGSQVDKKTLITNFVLKGTSKIFPATGNDKTNRANSVMNVLDFGNGYIHTDEFTPLNNDAATRVQLQSIVDGNRVVTIIEKVDGGANEELKFEVLGYESGMVASADETNYNENSGTRNFVVATKEGEEESTAPKLLAIEDATLSVYDATIAWIEDNVWTPTP